MLSIRQNVTTSLRRRYPTSLWSCHIVAKETSADAAKTTSLQRLIMTSLYEMLKRWRFCNVTRRFHHNYMATSERRWIATSQQRNDVFVSTGLLGWIARLLFWSSLQILNWCRMLLIYSFLGSTFRCSLIYSFGYQLLLHIHFPQ